MSDEIELYAITAGIAATKPNAVAKRASAIPGATVARLVSLEMPIAENVFIIPHTVPKRPKKGETEPVDAKKVIFFCKLSISLSRLTRITLSIRCSITTMFFGVLSKPFSEDLFNSRIATTKMDDIGSDGLKPTLLYKSSKEEPDQNFSSNFLDLFVTALKPNILSNIIAQLQIEARIRISITTLTTISASKNRC